ncbi:hypothetical protein HPB50_026423 [Hyalomma asiaticum]|uniref:Uncharacterized protein n=1 Tax=Hyalomma asiaticum TaxID=266040 RepID=A0ACB7RU63_HYAAI|nr:hypothetical protein HPB50_026423 [Hyalomma asiaticum]
MKTGGTSSQQPAVLQHDHSPPTDRGTKRSTPPPQQGVCSDPPPVETITMAPIPVIRLPTRLPPGHPGSPPPAYADDFRRFAVRSPSTLPDYCSLGVTTKGHRCGRFGHRDAPEKRAPDSTHDHQHLIVMGTHSETRQDAHVNPLHYCMVGVLVAGVSVAAALVLIDSPGGPISRHDIVQPEQESPRSARHPRLWSPYGMDEFGEGDDAGVDLFGPDEQRSLGVQASAVTGPFRTPDSSAKTRTVASSDDVSRDAEPVDSTAPKRRLRQYCSRHYYTYCTRPRTTACHYDPEELACVPSTALLTQLCKRGTSRFTI